MALRADALSRHTQEWEELAKVDRLWAILTSSDRLRGLGLSEQLLMMKMKLTPARGLAVPESEMRSMIERHGGLVELADAYGERAALEHVSSVRYFARAT